MTTVKYVQLCGGCYINMELVYQLVAVKQDWAGQQSPSIPKSAERRMVSIYGGFRPTWRCG